MTNTDLDTRPLFSTAATTTAEVIAAIRPDQLANPTPCPDLDVRGLLGHLLGVAARVTAIGRGDNPMQLPPETPVVADDAWEAAWRAAVAEADSAWRDDGALERTVVLPWATDRGANALLGYVNEITVHTWDVARATGQRPAWDTETAERALGLMHNWLPGEQRAEIFAEVRKKMAPGVPGAEMPDPFAAVVPVPDDAPAIDRLVAWNGRRP